ncbi:hypothetical protein H0H81_010885 [Sphagnurus paluster]|uniref:Uncharacterized protein n=1 Tax=Sphagnurus paluster TaxID=117069 RepID=A0A9P7K569_9AGAR|nr:hypothetical protein H0H81_010885 [Sphagnurus paluster]
MSDVEVLQESQWIDLDIVNNTNVALDIRSVKLSYGKFYNHGGSKSDEIPAAVVEGRVIPKGTSRYVMASCGRASSPSGTEGEFYVHIRGTTERVAFIRWNCPFYGDNFFSATTVSHASVKNTSWSRKGSLSYITVTIEGTL